MALAPAHTAEPLSDDAVALLRRGAADHLGLCCRPGEVVKLWPAISEAERAGYLRFVGGEKPWITPQGREAIGAPSEMEADMAKLRLLCANARKSLVPAKRADARTDFDYRSWKAMRWVCTLVVRQPDGRMGPRTVRVGRTIDSQPQFLGSKNSMIQPESDARFVLTLVPAWMTRPIKKNGDNIPAIFSTYPMPIDETDSNFTDDERAAWDRLRQICFSINSRIRNAGRGQRERLRFGENA
jgi:hypothetical protein